MIKIFFNPKPNMKCGSKNVNMKRVLFVWFIPLLRHQTSTETMKIKLWGRILAFFTTTFLQRCKT